jgi:hypothetical protein
MAFTPRRTRVFRRGGDVQILRQFRKPLVYPIGDILAVQVIEAKADIREYTSWKHQVNLVLIDRRMNLVARENDNRPRRRGRRPPPWIDWPSLARIRGTVLRDGRRLARFLRVPLVDQVQTMAVVEPDLLAGGDFHRDVRTGRGTEGRGVGTLDEPMAPVSSLTAHRSIRLGGDLVVEKTSDGLILRWPPRGWRPRWGHNPWRLVAAAFFPLVLGSLFALGSLGASWPWPALQGLLWSLVPFGVAALIVVTACAGAWRQTILTVRGDQLLVDYGRVCGVPLKRQWGRPQIATIGTQSNRLGETVAVKLCLRRDPPPFEPFLSEWTLARGRDPAELSWVAMALRQVLNVPAVEPGPSSQAS